MTRYQLEFPVCIYGALERVNDVVSKARVRIFYRYENRNGTYITDEFANELVSTLPWVPVKGIYTDGDFSDHGTEDNRGQVYGIVPESNNFAWEKHLDEDGVEREYACCDVYLLTALFPEANTIPEKGQSMELYPKTLQYHFEVIHGIKYVVFDHGRFLGLQVLGDKVEPCFEGASFYSLQKQIQDTIDKIKDYSNIGGQSEMQGINFKLSDSQKFDAIWCLLNPNYDAEHGWVSEYAVCEVFDEYALTYNYELGRHERVYYTKNDETDSVALGDRVVVYIEDVTENEKKTLDTLRALNGNTYELVNENLLNAEENANKCVEFSTKIEELNTQIATLNTEVENAHADVDRVNAQFTEAQAQITSLSTEVQSLAQYKKDVEDQRKSAVISEYASKLSDEVISTYKEQFDQYSVEELDMHLAYELKKTNPSMLFNRTPTPNTGVVPKNTVPKDSVNEILARYKK